MLFWLIVYCLLCWTAGYFILRHECSDCADLKHCYPPHVRRLASELAIASAPLWLPPAVAAVLWESLCESFQDWRLKRKHRVYQEYRFTPVNYFRLQPATRAWFDRSTRELFPLGFRLLGDYQLKEQPVSVIDRFFWRDEGAILGISTVAEAAARVEAVSLHSWLADGLCIETVAMESPFDDDPPQPDRDRLHITCVPEISTGDLFARHVQSVAELARQRGCGVLAFESETFQSLIIYDQRLHRTWQHRQGRSTPPPEPLLPTPARCLTPEEMLFALPAAVAEQETGSTASVACGRE